MSSHPPLNYKNVWICAALLYITAYVQNVGTIVFKRYKLCCCQLFSSTPPSPHPFLIVSILYCNINSVAQNIRALWADRSIGQMWTTEKYNMQQWQKDRNTILSKNDPTPLVDNFKSCRQPGVHTKENRCCLLPIKKCGNYKVSKLIGKTCKIMCSYIFITYNYY